MRRRLTNASLGILAVWGLVGQSLISILPADAQIVPDDTLGSESSAVTPHVLLEGNLIDRIDGGAIRGSQLFHSFQEFNVNDGQRVYFANPAAIENIFGRVTGFNGSEIFGTLGVLGNANLYLINPNGIIFGPDAQLDIRGSFIASTSDRIEFSDGYTFSAIHPTAPPLLVVNSPLGLASWLPNAGTIRSEADLTAGQDLTLASQTLDLRGQLQAGGDLTLLATATLTAQDSEQQPWIATSGNQLLMQGNQGLTINALTHPDSGLWTQGDLVLRSDQPIDGDAHFFTGGSFRIEQLDGSPGSLTSPNDPVVRASGDVTFASYTGASLHILAGGNVTVGDISITGPDASGNALQETVPLSDGQTIINIDGINQPTLDIRAGTLAFGSAGVTGDVAGFVPGAPAAGGTGTGANIAIDRITNPGGLVFLSNQYAPNPQLSGDITVGEINTVDINGGGDIVLDSRGNLEMTFVDASGGNVLGYLATFDPALFNGNGGDLTFLANGTITFPEFSEVYTYGLESGSVSVHSNTAITQGSDSFFEGSTIGFGTGGAFSLTAPAISINGGVAIYLDGEGTGGNLSLVADTFTVSADLNSGARTNFTTAVFGIGEAGNVSINADQISISNSFVGSNNQSLVVGKAGDVVIRTTALNGTNGAQIGSFTSADIDIGTTILDVVGDAGNVTVTATDAINLDGFRPEIVSGIFSSIDEGAEGNGGLVKLVTNTLSLTNGAQVRTSSLGTGNAGNIEIQAQNEIRLDGAIYDAAANASRPSTITSEVVRGGAGQGGNISIRTGALSVTNGGVITANTDSSGNAGNIDINATGAVVFDGVTAFDIPTLSADFAVRESALRSRALAQATGSGGNVTVTAPSLAVTNGARLEVTTLGAGSAGSIKLNITDTVLVDGPDSAISASTASGSTGTGGSINIDPRLVRIQNGGQVSVASEGTGAAGNLRIQGGSLILDRGLVSAETLSSTGGDITLEFGDVIVLLNGSRISTTAGTALAGGNGGNIRIETTYLIANPNGNNDITANAFLGSGGRVFIVAEGIFGLTPRSRGELEALLGTTDPALLDPARLGTSDITAISRTNPELSGQVIIQSPDVDPSQGTVGLPEGIVDASRLIAQGCASGGNVAQEIGSLVVTGRGGLPANPSETLQGNQVLLDWATLDSPGEGAAATEPEGAAIAYQPRQLQEVQALAVNAEGQVVLLAQAAAGADANIELPTLTCAGEIQEDLP